MQEVEETVIVPEFGSNVVLCTCRRYTWETEFVPLNHPEYMRFRLDAVGTEYDRCFARALKVWAGSCGYTMWPSLASYQRWLGAFGSPHPTVDSFVPQRVVPRADAPRVVLVR
ncbi:unnamed protein product [Durusdinium trenchii]|uniref:Uncharacterized protein n=1 Tax=Durusdinium trenchii TaxID=1381693 RepID=A0ABP0NHH3_9DINO